MNGSELLVPTPGVVRETFTAPTVAPTEISKIAVSAVALETTLLIVMPGLGLTDAPVKLVPLKKTVRDVPCLPLLGLSKEMDGPTPVTVNATGLLVLPPADTVTRREPIAASDKMFSVAVI